DDHPLAQHAGDTAAQDARRDEVRDVLLSVDHQRVSRVRAAAPTDDDLSLLGEQIDDLALTFVSPLRSDDDDDGHLFLFLFSNAALAPGAALARAPAPFGSTNDVREAPAAR